MNIKRCSVCKLAYFYRYRACPHCGGPRYGRFWDVTWDLVLAFVVTAAIFAYIIKVEFF